MSRVIQAPPPEAEFLGQDGQSRLRLTVLFAVRRGSERLISVQPEPLEGGYRDRIFEGLYSRDQLAEGELPRLVFSERGESLDVVAVGWSPEAAADGSARITKTPIEEVFEWRTELTLSGAPSEAAFNEFDAQTLDEMRRAGAWVALDRNDAHELAFRKSALDDVQALLMRGVLERRDGPYGIRPYATRLTEARRAQLAHVSKLFWNAFAGLRAGAPGADGVRLVADAFDLFARAQLMLFTPGQPPGSPAERDQERRKQREFKIQACQPNSAYYVFFAELADLCVENEVDHEDWGLLRPHLVKTIDFFRVAYQRRCFKANLDGYAPHFSKPSSFSLADGRRARDEFLGRSARAQARRWRFWLTEILGAERASPDVRA